MNTKLKKSLAAVLCCTVVAGGICASAMTSPSEDKEREQNDESAYAVDYGNEADYKKDETVYVFANADGSVEKIIVSDWIANAAGSSTVPDKSELENVENIKGDEGYTVDGNNMRVWDARGNDIYYRGEIKKELPVDINVFYTLDGKSISPSELAGKSGKVTIRFEYTNNQYQTVEIDGRKEKIYVPFGVLTGILLDNSVFRNVEVSNGKLINDGDCTVVVGVAFPGLQSNLNIADDKLEIPNYVEITADVKSFELSNTVTVAINGIFNSLDVDKLDSATSSLSSLDELGDAMAQLMDGSSALYDGLCTLAEKSEELISGIDKLALGAEKLKNGTGDLSKGAAELAAGTKVLSDGLTQLAQNNNTLNAGAKQVFDSLLNMAGTQLGAAGIDIPTLTIENYSSILNGVINSLDEAKIMNQAREIALQKVTAAVNAKKNDVIAAVSSAVREQVTAQVSSNVREAVKSKALAGLGFTEESFDAAISAGMISDEQKSQLEAAVDAQMQTDDVKAVISANTDAQMQSPEVQNAVSTAVQEQIELLIRQNMDSDEVQAQINAAVGQAKAGAVSVVALKKQLDSYNTFYLGLYQYTSGVSSAKNGAEALKDGADKLKDGAQELDNGAEELYNGILTLKNGAPALVDGVLALRDGSMQLSEGLSQFNEQGVKKLIDAVDGDLGSLVARIRATVAVSKDYKSFSGIADNTDGNVKFVYRTNSVKVGK